MKIESNEDNFGELIELFCYETIERSFEVQLPDFQIDMNNHV